VTISNRRSKKAPGECRFNVAPGDQVRARMRIIVPPAGTHCGQARGVSSPDIGAGASGPLALLIVVLAMAARASGIASHTRRLKR
jgi:hypothetical protein